jgi:hypothetical protein
VNRVAICEVKSREKTIKIKPKKIKIEWLVAKGSGL